MRQYSSRIEHTPKEICRARATLLERNPVAQISLPRDAASKHRHRPGSCANCSWNHLHSRTNRTCLQLVQHNRTGTSCLTFKKWKICCHISAGRTSSIHEGAIFSVFLCSVEVEAKITSSQNRLGETRDVERKQTRDFCTLLCVFQGTALHRCIYSPSRDRDDLQRH